MPERAGGCHGCRRRSGKTTITARSRPGHPQQVIVVPEGVRTRVAAGSMYQLMVDHIHIDNQRDEDYDGGDQIGQRTSSDIGNAFEIAVQPLSGCPVARLPSILPTTRRGGGLGDRRPRLGTGPARDHSAERLSAGRQVVTITGVAADAGSTVIFGPAPAASVSVAGPGSCGSSPRPARSPRPSRSP
jgi:hypothetical protein